MSDLPTWPPRSRVGLMVPSSNTAAEADLRDGLPVSVSLHTSRMLLKDVSAESELVMVQRHAPRAALELHATAPDVIVFSCTSATTVLGPAGAKMLMEQLTELVGGTPIVAANDAVIEAISVQQPRRIAVLTPYTADLNRHMLEAHHAAGLPISFMAGMGLVDNTDIGKLSPDDILSFADQQLRDQDFDLLFLSCTNLRTMHVVQALTRRWKTPVITSNSACVDKVRAVLGIGSAHVGLDFYLPLT